MKTKKSTKRALISSMLILAMCFTMLAGTTFAWFTDSVSSANNIIKSGKLDMEVQYYDAGDPANNVDPSWKALDNTTKLFDDAALYEPGYTQVAYIKVKNVGTLALKYQLAANIVSETAGVSAAGEFKLSDYLMFGTVETDAVYATREAAREAVATNAKALKELNANNAGHLDTTNAESGIIALVVYMPETVGNEANYTTTQPQIALGINVAATQYTYEADGFGIDYDANAELPAQKIVASTAELTAALADPEVTNIVLNADVDNAGWVNLDTGSKTIDLNGHELDGSVYAYGDSNVTISGGEVTGAVYVDGDANLTIEDDATTGSVILYNSADEATIDIYGKVEGYLWVMGNIQNSASVINFYGEIETDDDIGLALAGDATVNIYDGAKIKSTTGTGIEVRAGNLNVYGGTIEGNGTFSVTPNGSGTTTTGCGIAVCQHTTKLPINVNISGGTITGSAYGLYEGNPQANDPYGPVVINVTGGTITGGTQNIVRL